MKSHTKYRKPIYITNEHLELYKELAAKGFTLTQARQHEQQIFNMPESHSEQAVRSRCRTVDIIFRKGKRGKGQTIIVKRTDHELTWSEQQETLLQCLLMAKKAKDFEAENWRLRNRIGALEAENKNLSAKTDYERRYNLAVQQGDIKSPLKHSNFTEHILLYDPKSIFGMPDSPNISESAFCFS